MSSFQKLLKKSKKFPNIPGIYWFSKKGKKIYIGKAGSLKKRIASYFRASDPRIKMMVDEADNISFKKTNSVLEAVILEANAIKKYWPKYNIKEKDNRSFVYLVISKGDYPKIFIARGREVEKYIYPPHSCPQGQLCGGLVFGPYQSYRTLKTALNLARKIFPFGTCRPNQGAPCFDYQISLCPGICIGAISKKDYQKNIKNLLLFFRGEHKRLIKKLKRENPEKVFALQHVNDVALINNSKIVPLRGISRREKNSVTRIEGYDISHFGGKEPVGAMVVFSGGQADNIEYRLFKIKSINTFDKLSVDPEGDRRIKNNFDDLAMLEEVLQRRFNHKEWPMPDIILIDGGRNQVARAKKVTKERNIFIPIVGIAKILGHSGRAYLGDRLFFTNVKPSVKKLLTSSKILLQRVRNEAHRFAISFQRKRRKLRA
ncbi:MAG: GIY-YIG nuclease family protein [Candidatus Azambacteria bacterium]|nr:GIY-YIG nuclease family protein [Candidatus Azambacteria bacterium]